MKRFLERTPAGGTLCLVVVGTLCWLALSSAFGETDTIKGISFACGGAAVAAMDLLQRRHANVDEGVKRYFLALDRHNLLGMPNWMWGIGFIAAGIAIGLGIT